MMEEHYRTLGLERDADRDTVRRAYRELVKQHHPDLRPGDPQAEATFRRIHQAYTAILARLDQDEAKAAAPPPRQAPPPPLKPTPPPVRPASPREPDFEVQETESGGHVILTGVILLMVVVVVWLIW